MHPLPPYPLTHPPPPTPQWAADAITWDVSTDALCEMVAPGYITPDFFTKGAWIDYSSEQNV